MPEQEPIDAPESAAGPLAGPDPGPDHEQARQWPVLLALILGQMGTHAGMAGLRLAMPLQSLREGMSAWGVGLLLALFAAAPVVTAMHAGRLADRLGYHRPVQLAVSVGMLGCVLALLATLFTGPLHFALLCGAAMAAGTGTNVGMMVVLRTAGLVARHTKERVQIFSWLGIAPSFANVVGPVAAGFMIDAAGFRAAYGLMLLLPLVSLASSRFVPHLAIARAESDGPKRRAWDLLRSPGLKRLLVVNWLLSMCWDVHTFAVPILGHERGFSASTIGLILGAFTMAVTVVRLIIPWLAHRLNETTVLRSAMLGTGAVFALYPLAPTPALMGACAVLLGFTLGCVQPMVMTMLHHLTPDGRHGEALALRSMAINLSSTLMPLLFGAVGVAVGAAALFWAVGGAVGAGSWLARRLAAGA